MASRRCCVSGCSNRSYLLQKNCNNLHFFSFPRAGMHRVPIKRASGYFDMIDRKQAWELLLLNGIAAKPSDRVCSDHFLPTDFIENNYRTLLRSMSVPSRNLPGEKSAVKIKYSPNIEESKISDSNAKNYIFPDQMQVEDPLLLQNTAQQFESDKESDLESFDMELFENADEIEHHEPVFIDCNNLQEFDDNHLDKSKRNVLNRKRSNDEFYWY